MRRRHWATPPADVRNVQPQRIPLRDAHYGRTIGEALHLHRPQNGSLWGVFSIDYPLADRGFYLSVETDSDLGGGDLHVDTIVTGAAIVERSAQTGLSPGRYLPGRLDRQEEPSKWQLSQLERRIVEAAIETIRTRSRARDVIEIHDDASPDVVLRRRSLDDLAPVERLQLLEEQDWTRRPPVRSVGW